jgi:hypothetical protein
MLVFSNLHLGEGYASQTLVYNAMGCGDVSLFVRPAIDDDDSVTMRRDS